MFNGFLVLLIIISSLLFYIRKKFYSFDKSFLEMTEKIPGPKGYPFLGVGHLFLGASAEDILQIITDICKNDEPITGIWLGWEYYVFIKTPQDAEVILNSKTMTKKPRLYKIIENGLREGLITIEGDKWKKHRKLLNPMFYSKALQYYVKGISSKVLHLCDLLEAEFDKDFDIFPYLERCNFSILIGSNVPEELESEFIPEMDKMAKHFKMITEEIMSRITKPWLSSSFVYENLPRGKIMQSNQNYLWNLVSMMIARTKRSIDSNGSNFEKNGGTFTEFMLNIQAEPENEWTEKEILDEVSTICGAAFETTTAAIGFVLFLLSKHSDVQEKVVEEIRQEFGNLDEDKQITYDDLLKLKYLDRVMKESLRMYPTSPFIGRHILEDTKLPSGYTLPKGSLAVISLYDVHKDQKMFPNPEKFDPDNFLPEKVAARHPKAFIPFSTGPRNCIGQKYAMLSIKTHVIALLRRFVLTPTQHELNLMSPLVLQPTNGFHLRIQRRTLSESTRFVK